MESPFTHRLNSNYIPSDEEIERIEMDLLLHTDELARLDECIRELSAQRDQIQAYVDSHRALVSRPRRFPQILFERYSLPVSLPVGTP